MHQIHSINIETCILSPNAMKTRFSSKGRTRKPVFRLNNKDQGHVLQQPAYRQKLPNLKKKEPLRELFYHTPWLNNRYISNAEIHIALP